MRRHRRRSQERDGGTENAAPQAPLRRKTTNCTWSSTQKAHMQQRYSQLFTVGGHCTHRATRPPPQRSCLNNCRTDHAHSGTAQERAQDALGGNARHLKRKGNKTCAEGADKTEGI
eukprot:gene11229-biopygen16845